MEAERGFSFGDVLVDLVCPVPQAHSTSVQHVDLMDPEQCNLLAKKCVEGDFVGTAFMTRAPGCTS